MEGKSAVGEKQLLGWLRSRPCRERGNFSNYIEENHLVTSSSYAQGRARPSEGAQSLRTAAMSQLCDPRQVRGLFCASVSHCKIRAFAKATSQDSRES